MGEDKRAQPDQAAPGARRRLDQAHELWHRALEVYAGADDFCTAVNALIPSIRSVTFVLQKELAHRDGFDAWYENWRLRMREDPVLRWLVEARNYIEKQGDLEMRSTARVSVVAGWLPGPFLELDVPPLMPPHLIATRVAQEELPQRLKDEGLIRVERRWVTIALPGVELLDGCAHVWAFLDGVVGDAECTFAVTAREGVENGGRRPPCMIAGPEARSAVLDLASGEFVEVESIQRSTSDDDIAHAQVAYAAILADVPKPTNSLEGRVRWHHEFGRRMLAHDGQHMFAAFLFRRGLSVGIIELTPEDQPAKYLLMERLAGHVQETSADEVIVSSETWVAPPVPVSDERFDLRAGQREDRTEAFITVGANNHGDRHGLSSAFSRVAGRIELGDAEPFEGIVLSLAPVLHVWGLEPMWKSPFT